MRQTISLEGGKIVFCLLGACVFWPTSAGLSCLSGSAKKVCGTRRKWPPFLPPFREIAKNPSAEKGESKLLFRFFSRMFADYSGLYFIAKNGSVGEMAHGRFAPRTFCHSPRTFRPGGF